MIPVLPYAQNSHSAAALCSPFGYYAYSKSTCIASVITRDRSITQLANMSIELTADLWKQFFKIPFTAGLVQGRLSKQPSCLWAYQVLYAQHFGKTSIVRATRSPEPWDSYKLRHTRSSSNSTLVGAISHGSLLGFERARDNKARGSRPVLA